MNRVNFNSGQQQMQTQGHFSRINLLNQFIGQRCTCEFYLDSDIVKKTGLLDSVGTDFIVLISTNNPDERLVCPLNELKFIKFY